MLNRALVNIENEYNDDNSIEEIIRQAVEKAFKDFQKDHQIEVFVLLTNNEVIREINKEQREIDNPTDVLSFPLLDMIEGVGTLLPEDINPETNRLMMGDMVISLERAKEQSIEYGHSYEREVGFLATHGALHLMGYDHDTQEKEQLMFGLQEDVLKNIGLER